MAAGPEQLVLLGILAAGSLLVVYAVVALATLGWLRRRERAAEGPLEPGVLAVEGTASVASGREPVYSPVTGTEAILYQYAVQHLTGSPATPDWRTVATGQAGVPFDLDTPDGSVRVVPSGASMELPVDEEIEFEADPDRVDSDEPPFGAVRFAGDGETIVLGDVELVPGDQYRVVERRIRPGDTVRVTGVASRADATDGDASHDSGLALREHRSWLRRFVGVPFVIGDDDGGAATSLRNRAIVGVIFGLPLVMLATVYLFPPAS